MSRIRLLSSALLFGACGLWAQAPSGSEASAVAARCQVITVRQVGLVTLSGLDCPENKLRMEVWLPPREKASWLANNVWVNVVPTGMGQDIHVSPGRAPRSDYSRPKPVHVLIIGLARAGKVTATLLSLTFH